MADNPDNSNQKQRALEQKDCILFPVLSFQIKRSKEAHARSFIESEQIQKIK